MDLPLLTPTVQSHKLTFFNLVHFGCCARAVRPHMQLGAKFGPQRREVDSFEEKKNSFVAPEMKVKLFSF